MEQKIETRKCKNCSKDFVIESDDFSFYEKIGVSAPTHCYDCRLQRRMTFRNERSYYKRKCDLCEKGVISSYAEDAPFPVYCHTCWWSDDWDRYSHGADFNFSRPFFEQFQELFSKVPRICVVNDDGVASKNSPFTYDIFYSKNCYLCVCAWHLENVSYSYHTDNAKDLTDCYYVNNSENCYQCVTSDKCSRCIYCTLCFDSVDCILGLDLRGCSDCIMSVGLRNKKYHILNKEYTKEEYLEKKEEMDLGNRAKMEQYVKEFEEFALKFPRRYAYMIRSVNSTGNMLVGCKQTKDSFFYLNLEDCRYMTVGDTGKDSYDCNNTGKTNLAYESSTPDESYGNIATVFCLKCNKAEYSDYCHASNNVLGCVGLKNGEYCILNKKYSREEFVDLRERIIEHMKKGGEWGEFFPIVLSPFAYNESAAQDWFPLTKEQAEEEGYKWKEDEKKNHDFTIPANQVPDTIADASDDILKQVIECGHRGDCNHKCTTAFKLIDQEVQFYKKLNIPLPNLCPNCRYYQRLERRNPPKLWHRQCYCAGAKSEDGVYENTGTHDHGEEHCKNEFETSYAPDRPEIVYCEDCYNAEIV